MSKSSLLLLIPVYNDPGGLETTLRSLESQSFEYEILIVDDGSSIPPSIEGNRINLRISILRLQKNEGIVSALNVGLDYALSRDYSYIARLDAGDVPLDGRFVKQLELLQSNPRIGLVGAYTQFVNPQGKHLYVWKPPHESKKLRRFMHMQNAFVHSSVMYPTAVIREVGGYRNSYVGAEDFDLFWRIARKYEIAMIPEILMRCELNPKGLSMRKRRQQLSSILTLRLKY